MPRALPDRRGHTSLWSSPAARPDNCHHSNSWPAGSAADKIRRRNSDTHYPAPAQRKGDKRCIRTNKSSPPANPAAAVCYSAHRWVVVAEPSPDYSHRLLSGKPSPRSNGTTHRVNHPDSSSPATRIDRKLNGRSRSALSPCADPDSAGAPFPRCCRRSAYARAACSA